VARRSAASYIADSSAVLAVLKEEPEAHAFRRRLPLAVMSTVNMAELLSHADRDGRQKELERLLRLFDIRVEDFTREDMREVGDSGGQRWQLAWGVADGACLVLARRLGAVALTKEVTWEAAGRRMGVQVEVFNHRAGRR
jgi:ribonuclease VapC